MSPDGLRPAAADALAAWSARVRANRLQVDEFRESRPEDFYGTIAGMFRVDPFRRGEPTLDALLSLVRLEDTLLDIGAGGGRYALPLALVCREVIAVDPSEGMLGVLRSSIEEHGIRNVRVVHGRWPLPDLEADIALIAHLGYDVEQIGQFLDAMEAAAHRLCVAVLLEQPPPRQADLFGRSCTGLSGRRCPLYPSFSRCCWRAGDCSTCVWSTARPSHTTRQTARWRGSAGSCGPRPAARKTFSCRS